MQGAIIAFGRDHRHANVIDEIAEARHHFGVVRRGAQILVGHVSLVSRGDAQRSLLRLDEYVSHWLCRKCAGA